MVYIDSDDTFYNSKTVSEMVQEIKKLAKVGQLAFHQLIVKHEHQIII